MPTVIASDDGKLTDMDTTHVQESQDGGAPGAASTWTDRTAPAWFVHFEERFNRIMATTRHEIGNEIQDLKQALESVSVWWQISRDGEEPGISLWSWW